MEAPEAQPLGYVEGAFEARTTLADFFIILLRLFNRLFDRLLKYRLAGLYIKGQ